MLAVCSQWDVKDTLRYNTAIASFILEVVRKGFSNELLVLDTALNAWQIPAVGGVKPSAREGHTHYCIKTVCMCSVVLRMEVV